MTLFGSLYRFTSLSTGKIYIGSTSKPFASDRKQGHIYLLRRNKHTNRHLQNIYNKYGEADLIFVVIGAAYFEDQQQLRMCEGRAIRAVPQQLRLNFNLEPTINYWLGKTASPEIREKLRLSHLGHKPSSESIARGLITRRDYVVSEQTRAKIGLGHKGMTHTAETKQHLSEVHKGKHAPNRKLTQDQADEIRLLKTDGVTTSELSRRFGIDRKCIRNILSGLSYRSEECGE